MTLRLLNNSSGAGSKSGGRGWSVGIETSSSGQAVWAATWSCWSIVLQVVLTTVETSCAALSELSVERETKINNRNRSGCEIKNGHDDV